MSEYLEKALKKLADAKTPKGVYAAAVFRPVKETLKNFCRQEEEFARAVVQGGSVEECCEVCVKNVQRHISDIEVYRKAAEFFFPGCRVEMTMKLYMSEYDRESEAAEQAAEQASAPAVTLNLADFW